MYSSAHAVVARAVAAAEARAAAAEATASGMVQAARGAHEGLRAALQVSLPAVGANQQQNLLVLAAWEQ